MTARRRRYNGRPIDLKKLVCFDLYFLGKQRENMKGQVSLYFMIFGIKKLVRIEFFNREPNIGVRSFVAESPDSDTTKVGVFYEFHFVFDGLGVIKMDLINIFVFFINNKGAKGGV